MIDIKSLLIGAVSLTVGSTASYFIVENNYQVEIKNLKEQIVVLETTNTTNNYNTEKKVYPEEITNIEKPIIGDAKPHVLPKIRTQ